MSAVELNNQVGSEYLAARHQELSPDYPPACFDEAIDIADVLIRNGQRPSIFLAIGDGWRQRLKPKFYSNPDGFGSHALCVSNRTVYDPMIGRPVSWIEYDSEAFEPSARSYSKIMTTEAIIEHINRR